MDFLALAVTVYVDIEESGVRLKLTVVDTPGFGDFVNNDDSSVSSFRNCYGGFVLIRDDLALVGGNPSSIISKLATMLISSKRIESTVPSWSIIEFTHVSTFSSRRVIRK